MGWFGYFVGMVLFARIVIVLAPFAFVAMLYLIARGMGALYDDFGFWFCLAVLAIIAPVLVALGFAVDSSEARQRPQRHDR